MATNTQVSQIPVLVLTGAGASTQISQLPILMLGRRKQRRTVGVTS